MRKVIQGHNHRKGYAVVIEYSIPEIEYMIENDIEDPEGVEFFECCQEARTYMEEWNKINNKYDIKEYPSYLFGKI